eukprot:CAMPEP_0114237274 /NCGR_PEP_ID=MMETSP0058-20121206/7296_1 /TAXON_ID=36894 /ORGANISM="Pyramimonas parkeae, CCMP726" /LENGTH=200 /DNA_ID=CAMNT_0001349291 /DNA_START=1207 /DNA_END=1809 /DNA_ORIENTATION=+
MGGGGWQEAVAHLVVDELLPKGFAFERVPHRLLKTHARQPVGLDDEAPSLVVEVVHDLLEPAVLHPNEVFRGHLDVGEGDVRRPRGPYAGALHLSALHSGHASLHQQHGQAVLARAARATSHGEVVGEHAVGDPFLLPVDHVEGAGGVLLGGAAQPRHVAPGVRLRNAQADDLVALQAVCGHLVLEQLRTKVKNRRQADL